jgi:16S rRNA (guanine527-N7)-methyltransferase
MNVTISGRSVEVPSGAKIRSSLAEFDKSAATLSDLQIGQIQKYIAILLLWNDKLSLTAVTDPAEILPRHFGEALSALPFLSTSGRLADVGTGAGFPGIALKIFQPKLQVLLIEQNAKKAAFLHEVIRLLELGGVSVQRLDYQSLSPEIAPFDIIAARALGSYRDVANWALSRLAAQGKLLLWLGEEESAKLSALPDWRFEPPARLPTSRQRVLLVGTPTQKQT